MPTLASARTCLKTILAGASLCFGTFVGAASAPASIPASPSTGVWLQTGNANDAYWVDDNRWGAGAITEGTAATQFEQAVGVSPEVGSEGEVAFRMKWRWPNPSGAGEVKAYPGIVSGRKPGYASASNYVDNRAVRLTDGSVLQASPSGQTPGTIFPLQLPLQSLKAKVAFKHLTPATGQGQLTFDIWLQSNARQDKGFTASSITHEIMVPLDSWGNYGVHNVPGGRNPGWYDHDATIGGKLYHVYISKDGNGASYNFGWLNGSHGKSGWKMIAFVPDVMPVAAGEIDLAAILNYVSTRKDAKGKPWADGNEYVSSVELGVEPVAGTGDIMVYDYKVSATGMTATPSTTFAPAGAQGTASKPAATSPTQSQSQSQSPSPASRQQSALTPAASCTSAGWAGGKSYSTGAVVSYNGATYIARHDNPGYNPTISTYFWSSYYCDDGSTSLKASTAPVANVAAPGACNSTSWDDRANYSTGSVVTFNGGTYIAKSANPGYNPTISTYYWAPHSCLGS